jgi:hypothetical protein
LDKDTPVKEKLEDLFRIVDSNKIGMMTTCTSDGLLVSRAMVLLSTIETDSRLSLDERMVLTLCSLPIPKLAKLQNWKENLMLTYHSTMASTYAILTTILRSRENGCQ